MAVPGMDIVKKFIINQFVNNSVRTYFGIATFMGYRQYINRQYCYNQWFGRIEMERRIDRGQLWAVQAHLQLWAAIKARSENLDKDSDGRSDAPTKDIKRKYKLIITLAETKLITKQTKLACNIRTHTLFKVNMANIYYIDFHSFSISLSIPSHFQSTWHLCAFLFSSHGSSTSRLHWLLWYVSSVNYSLTSLDIIIIIVSRLLALTAFTALAALTTAPWPLPLF